MAITLSKNAATQVRSFLKSRKKSFGLRFGVRMSGCSGMTYVIEFINEPSSEDVIFEDKGIKIVVSKKNLQFLDGTQLDFVKEGLSESFKFTNPNTKNSCSCGKSFNVY